MAAVGSFTRPDIAHTMSTISHFLLNLGKEHWNAAKWIMRYLRGTCNLKPNFGDKEPILVGNTYADIVGDVDSRKSTLGFLITFVGGAVAWQSRLRKCALLSTIEAKFIATTKACKELLGMKNFLHELGFNQTLYVLYCDNQSAIHHGKNSTFHARSKHIDVKYHWVCDMLNSMLLELEKIHRNDNGVDMLTKSLPREKLELCSMIAGIAKI